MTYILDANTFIEAKNRYCRMDVCPGYWDWIMLKHGTNELCSIDRVAHELSKMTDDLAVWAEAHPQLFEATRDAQTQGHYGAVVNHVATLQHLKAGAIPEFLRGADPWLIARALRTGATIVTHEVYQPAMLRKVSIPNVCAHFSVPCVNTFESLSTLQAEFVLAA